jgi:hypothetical protein
MKTHLEAKRSVWKAHVERWESSNQSVVQWCREQDLPYKTFLYWRKQFAKKPVVDRASFLELSSESTESGVSIDYNGMCIHITKAFDPKTLLDCLQTLKGAL